MRNCALIPLVVICALLPAAAWSQLPPPYCTQWGSWGTGQGQFDTPYGIAIDAAGHVYHLHPLRSLSTFQRACSISAMSSISSLVNLMRATLRFPTAYSVHPIR